MISTARCTYSHFLWSPDDFLLPEPLDTFDNVFSLLGGTTQSWSKLGSRSLGVRLVELVAHCVTRHCNNSRKIENKIVYRMVFAVLIWLYCIVLSALELQYSGKKTENSLYFICGTIEGNSQIWTAVLLFQPRIVPQSLRIQYQIWLKITFFT